jgi:hypothetical protein
VAAVTRGSIDGIRVESSIADGAGQHRGGRLLAFSDPAAARVGGYDRLAGNLVCGAHEVQCVRQARKAGVSLRLRVEQAACLFGSKSLPALTRRKQRGREVAFPAGWLRRLRYRLRHDDGGRVAPLAGTVGADGADAHPNPRSRREALERAG